MDEILIVDYDPAWPAQFADEAARLRAALGVWENGGFVTRMEHFGSTAVPGLDAKPVIDLLVGVTTLDAARRHAVPILTNMGYAYWADNPDDANRLFFVKGLPSLSRSREIAPRRTHHLHLIEPNSPLWERLLFRDYLRAHPAARDEYAILKHRLAAQFPDDREAYTNAKSDFIQAAMEKARQVPQR